MAPSRHSRYSTYTGTRFTCNKVVQQGVAASQQNLSEVLAQTFAMKVNEGRLEPATALMSRPAVEVGMLRTY